MNVWFWCATVDNYDPPLHYNTPSASGIVIAEGARFAFDLAGSAARDSLPDNCNFTITQFNKVS